MVLTFNFHSEIAEILNSYAHPEGMTKLITNLTSKLNSKENVKWNEEYIPRPLGQQTATRLEAKSKLVSAWPEAFGRFLGNEMTNSGVSRIFDLCQSSLLNKHLLFTLLEDILQVLVEEL